MKEVQSELEVEEGAVAARRQVTAELAEQQLIGNSSRRGGDVGGDGGAAVDPVVDVVAEVSSKVTAVRQNVQRDARERQQGGDFLQNTADIRGSEVA